ncbi:nematocyst expressed protein 3-like [Penaeus chinensis]|uniref:nematocyst expressed protein 3-like n=1 Tax=Penaeus chinensis TaxID=139456 RepID=UPI001FB68437|nr:nematocyst expressed protein 3-like [Penaeus chinensis]
MHRAGRSFKVQPARVAAVLGVNGRSHPPPASVHASMPVSTTGTGNHLTLASPVAQVTQERLIHGSAPARAEDHLEPAGVSVPDAAAPLVHPIAPESEGPALENLKEALLAVDIKLASASADASAAETAPAAAEVEAAPVAEVEAASTEAAPVSAAAQVAAQVPVAEIITEAKASETIVEAAPVVETEAVAETAPVEAAASPAAEAEAAPAAAVEAAPAAEAEAAPAAEAEAAPAAEAEAAPAKQNQKHSPQQKPQKRLPGNHKPRNSLYSRELRGVSGSQQARSFTTS